VVCTSFAAGSRNYEISRFWVIRLFWKRNQSRFRLAERTGARTVQSVIASRGTRSGFAHVSACNLKIHDRGGRYSSMWTRFNKVPAIMPRRSPFTFPLRRNSNELCHMLSRRKLCPGLFGFRRRSRGVVNYLDLYKKVRIYNTRMVFFPSDN